MSKVVSFREFARRPEEEITLLHSPFYPDECFEGDKTSATLTLTEGAGRKSWEFRVWRLSPLGVELLVEPRDRSDAQGIDRGARVDLRVRIGKQTSEFTGLVIASTHRDQGRDLIGIRWCPPAEPGPDAGSIARERRKGERWLCGIDFLPTGIAPNPLRFNDFIHFKVRDLSLEGMQLYTSLRNKQLIPGMTLDSVVSLPLTGEIRFKLKIVNTRILTIDGRDYLSLGTTLVNQEERIREVLGQYIFQFGPGATVADLKSKGFRIKSPSSAVEFGYVRTAEEYREVLALRKATYSAAGKMNQGAPEESAADIYDSRARILTARYRGQLVACARIMFHDPEDQMEHEQFTSLPETFPRKDEIAELTRICTHPEYRGSDLFFGIIRHITLTVAQSNRGWILGSAEPKLVGAYTRLGYRRTGVFYEHKDLGGIRHELLLGNLTQMLSGEGVSVSLWNELYSGLAGYLENREMVEFDPYMNLRMRVFGALGPFTRLMTGPIRTPRKA